MCGISCILSLANPSRQPSQGQTNGNGTHTNGNTPSSKHDKLKSDLYASLEAIRHRGPDGTGHWISDDCRVAILTPPPFAAAIALGHVRLSINDLSPTGAQPFHSPAHNIHAVVNGEFYDYDNLRAHLEIETAKPTKTNPNGEPYPFTSRSDSELVVALYSHYGLTFTQYLRGEFACVIYDARKDLFIAVRDRYGIKPLFWTMQEVKDEEGRHTGEKRMLVAAEMKAFLPLGWEPEWDVRSLREGGWNFDTRTSFMGVRKIRPGHYMTCQSSGQIEERPYWDAEFPDKHVHDPRTPNEMIEGVRSRMLDAVRLRLRADVPIGIYLSGGIDSSVIAGMVAHLVREQNVSVGCASSVSDVTSSSKVNDPSSDIISTASASSRITCFSIAFDESSGYDESAIANRTAEHLGVKYIKKLMNEAALAERFEDAVWHCEQHNPDLNFVGKFALSEVPQEEGYKVVLTGEGADEIFAGYPLYLPDYLREPDRAWEEFCSLPESERQVQLRSAEGVAREQYRAIGADAGDGSDSVARRMLNGISTVDSMAAFQPDVFASWTKEQHPECDPQTTIASSVDGLARTHIAKNWHPLHAALYVWSKGHLPNIFLTCLGDRTEMAHSIEARTPFLDHFLTEYVNRLPPSVKLRWLPKERRFVEKWILREAARPFITEELYLRKKHPYSAPTRWPKGGALHRLLGGLVTEESVAALGFVAWEKVGGLVEVAFGEEADAKALRMVLVVAEWVVLSRRFGVARARAW
ncbi:hypothetical protein LTR08_007030 [Meristemomyces frigidus]|nr:hypothetical protein LTR08_007030 [Meristemomyces frigidus]